MYSFSRAICTLIGHKYWELKGDLFNGVKLVVYDKCRRCSCEKGSNKGTSA